MVKCQIVPLSATANGPFAFSSFSSLLFFYLLSPLIPLLFCFIPPPTLFLLSGSINFLHLSRLIILVIPLLCCSSHPSYLCAPSLPLLSLRLYPQLISFSCLICCPFQFNIFQPCLLPNVHSHTHELFLLFRMCFSVSQALAVRYRLLQSVSFPCSMSGSRLGDTLTFSTLSQVLP